MSCEYNREKQVLDSEKTGRGLVTPLREATRDKKQLDFGFLLKGGGVKPEAKAFEELLKEPFSAIFWTFSKERGGGLTQIQTF